MNTATGVYYARKSVIIMSACWLGIGLVIGIKLAAMIGCAS